MILVLLETDESVFKLLIAESSYYNDALFLLWFPKLFN